jgi:RNA polymerase sigma-70 factor, ECF subfamily
MPDGTGEIDPRKNHLDRSAEELSYYTASLRRYACALSGQLTDAEDLVQETLKNVLVHVRNGKDIKDVRAYLFSTLHNLWCGEIAKRKRQGAVNSEIVDREAVCQGAQDLRVECRDLDAALRRLPDDTRCVVLLVGLEGYSYKAVAEMLDIPIGTVMSRLHRGRESLRTMMSEQSAVRVKRVK